MVMLTAAVVYSVCHAFYEELPWKYRAKECVYDTMKLSQGVTISICMTTLAMSRMLTARRLLQILTGYSSRWVGTRWLATRVETNVVI